MQDKELIDLIAAWLDGRLDDQQSLDLQGKLKDSSEARSVFREYTLLDATLHEIADTSGMSGPAKMISSATDKSPETKAEKATSSTGSVSNLYQSSVPPLGTEGLTFGRLATWGLAWCVTVAFAVMVVRYLDVTKLQSASKPDGQPSETSSLVAPTGVRQMSMEKPPAPVATLSSAKGAVWEDRQLQVGQQLCETESVKLLQGAARISVGFGAEIVANAPCEMTFLSSKRIHLHQGTVGVDVATWAKGFTVVTDEMDIVDLGTTFTVTASPRGNSETTVLKGVVRVHPSTVQNEKRRGLLVTEGQQVLVDETGLRKTIKLTQSNQLLSRLDFGTSKPYQPVVLNNSGLGLSEGDEDLHWRVVAGPGENFVAPQFATVCVAHERYLANDPDASQWISIADWESATPNSTYTFQTEFKLDDYDLSTMRLFGRFLADNGVAAVRVNGEPVPVQSWVDNVTYQMFGHSQFRFVNITDGLVAGQNTIEIDVLNGEMVQGKVGDMKHRAVPNPMALRVEWYAFGRKQQRPAKARGALKSRRNRQDTAVLGGFIDSGLRGFEFSYMQHN